MWLDASKKAKVPRKSTVCWLSLKRSYLKRTCSMLEEKLSGALIKQQTPLRVVHRRADLIRERYIYKLKVKKVSLKRALMEIHCQGGLYVKELVSGDEGRTNPNVSDLLGNRAKTLKLDVLKVMME